MRALRGLFGNWWVVSGLLALLAALILCVGLPLAIAPLDRLWVRLLLLGLVVMVWGLLAVFHLVAANRASARIARSLVEEDMASREQQVLATRMSQAITRMRSEAGKRRDYLYSRPWYVIIGPPAGGKTTALTNSGLHFPLADKELQGTGGTRNLDFFFTDEAVLVDTAGRYTTQDSGDPRDRDGWQAFLDLLRRNRPLQPINGVIVAMPLDELGQANVARIDEHAEIIRRRLAELRIGLQSAPPVYVMFTKADLVAGFIETFDDLMVDGRRAVLGSTFPWRPDEAVTPAEITSAFDDLSESISARMTGRLQEERDPRRRSLILGFPHQVTALRSRIVRLLDGAFRTPAHEQPTPLRGFYFTSGMQDGTPIDRILAAVSDVYDAPPAKPSGAGAGRAFFINQLLTEVIFREAGLAQPAPALVAKRNLATRVTLGAIGVASLLIVGLWTASLAEHLRWHKELETEAADIRGQLERGQMRVARVYPDDGLLNAVQPVLERLRGLPGGYGEQRGEGRREGALLRGLIYSDLGDKAEETYRIGLRRLLLPQLVLRLEGGLTDKSNSVTLYERLKVYKLLNGVAPWEPQTVKLWADNELRSIPLTTGQDGRDALARDVAAWVADKDYAAGWPNSKVPNKAALVEGAENALLNGVDQADRVYALLIQDMQGKGPDWQMSDTDKPVLDTGALQAFRDPLAVSQAKVPYHFTMRGYKAQYAAAMRRLEKRVPAEAWVLGEANARSNSIMAQMQTLKPQVGLRYARDYEAAWDAVLEKMEPADYFVGGEQGDRALSAVKQQPLAIVLREVVANTKFSGQTSANPAATAAAKKGLDWLGGAKKPAAAGLAAIERPESGALDAAQHIERHFSNLHDYVAQKKAEQFSDLLIKAVDAANSAKGPSPDVSLQGDFSRAKTALEGAVRDAPPGPVEKFVSIAAGKAQGTSYDITATALNAAYKERAMGACVSATQDLYPFAPGARADASMAAMENAFGVGQATDSFVNTRIRPTSFLDETGSLWHWNRTDPVASSFKDASAEQFQKSAQYRDLLAGGVSFQLIAIRFEGAATGADFVQGNQTYAFERGKGGKYDLTWMPRMGAYPARVVIRGANAKPIAFDGPWALVRLFQAANVQPADSPNFNATFSDGTARVTFQVRPKSQLNPFMKGFFLFRCQSTL